MKTGLVMLQRLLSSQDSIWGEVVSEIFQCCSLSLSSPGTIGCGPGHCWLTLISAEAPDASLSNSRGS